MWAPWLLILLKPDDHFVPCNSLCSKLTKTPRKETQKKDAMESMCYLLTFIFNQTEGQSHQSLNNSHLDHRLFDDGFPSAAADQTWSAPWNPVDGNLVFFLRKVTQKACWCMKSRGFWMIWIFFVEGRKIPWLAEFSCSEKVTPEAGKLTSSVPYHEDRCLPPKLNPPPLINKAFPLNRSVLQTYCIFVQHLLLASQNGPTVYIPVVTK